ncbi:MAG: hypothetical protein R3212_06625, partial [Xanthomonadales bacterium]|nr:hypothetical protein [Xanthomonadales bacterium]
VRNPALTPIGQLAPPQSAGHFAQAGDGMLQSFCLVGGQQVIEPMIAPHAMQYGSILGEVDRLPGKHPLARTLDVTGPRQPDEHFERAFIQGASAIIEEQSTSRLRLWPMVGRLLLYFCNKR